MKKVKALQSAHTSNAKIGMGDSYGSAIPNKIGKSIDVMGQKSMGSKKLKTPPKSLA